MLRGDRRKRNPRPPSSLIVAAPNLAGAICLEPTDFFAYVGHRGCLTYQIDLTGIPGHMGAGPVSLDPITAAAKVVLELREFEAELCREAGKHPGFAWTSRPFQVTVASIAGGGWIGSVADRCRVLGNVGLPPWIPIEAMEDRLVSLGRKVIPGAADRCVGLLGRPSQPRLCHRAPRRARRSRLNDRKAGASGSIGQPVATRAIISES